MARFAAERDHDIRAAYVCLLTAAVAHAGSATVVGDYLGGWFWLPPLHLWADWATAGVASTVADARKRSYPDVALTHAGRPAEGEKPAGLPGIETRADSLSGL